MMDKGKRSERWIGMTNTLQVVFECHSLPLIGAALPGCRRLGIQEAKIVVQDVPFEGKELIHFFFALQVEFNSAKPIFRGKYVQGPRSDPFIYLCWGEREGEAWAQTGRAKILLATIPGTLMERALREGSPLKARIRMVDARGNPAMATLKAGLVEWIEKPEVPGSGTSGLK
jgi:hypothetical protein